jgi:hypothetical protein
MKGDLEKTSLSSVRDNLKTVKRNFEFSRRVTDCGNFKTWRREPYSTQFTYARCARTPARFQNTIGREETAVGVDRELMRSRVEPTPAFGHLQRTAPNAGELSPRVAATGHALKLNTPTLPPLARNGTPALLPASRQRAE